MRLRILVVDDEPLAREDLQAMLSHDRDVADVRLAADGREAVAEIGAGGVDLVFLDVQMPEIDGFGVLQAVGAARMPEVVFVTAFDTYAVRAFDVNAIDYLLKPVTTERLGLALARAKNRLSTRPLADASQNVVALLETLARGRQLPKRIAVLSGERAQFIEVADIDWLEGAQNYVELHVATATHLVHVPIHRLVKYLDPTMFLRIHRSIVVNLRRIQELRSLGHGEYILRLRTGVQLRSGRSYRNAIKSLITNPF